MKPLILLISALSSTAGAATLEDQVKANKTVEQLYRAAVQDISDNVLVEYRDSLQIDDPVLEVLSSTSKTVDIKVSYTWHVPESVLEEMRDTLGKLPYDAVRVQDHRGHLQLQWAYGQRLLQHQRQAWSIFGVKIGRHGSKPTGRQGHLLVQQSRH
ncbi:hypothetical protein [Pseudomonas amygdali]|uniref:hypothetical protein n=1 Tax=Pseudomonas amygdali TaxID=47877 RepID=UPI0016722383|nr:hypothetical protein [Pseudomonas amygdali]